MAIVLKNKSEVQCCTCHRQMRDDEAFCGERMWNQLQFTCRHTTLYQCPECSQDVPWETRHFPSCPECGRDTVYT